LKFMPPGHLGTQEATPSADHDAVSENGAGSGNTSV
jgi:hypothetical protein